MNGERLAAALFLVLALTLPLSALIARGVPQGRVVRLVLMWAAIFLVVALIAGALPLRAATRSLHNTYYPTDGGR